MAKNRLTLSSAGAKLYNLCLLLKDNTSCKMLVTSSSPSSSSPNPIVNLTSVTFQGRLRDFLHSQITGSSDLTGETDC